MHRKQRRLWNPFDKAAAGSAASKAKQLVQGRARYCDRGTREITARLSKGIGLRSRNTPAA